MSTRAGSTVHYMEAVAWGGSQGYVAVCCQQGNNAHNTHCYPPLVIIDSGLLGKPYHDFRACVVVLCVLLQALATELWVRDLDSEC